MSDQDSSQPNSGRYELAEFFDDMGPETELVLKTMGIVLTVVMMGAALAFPILISCGSDSADPHAPTAAHAESHPTGTSSDH